MSDIAVVLGLTELDAIDGEHRSIGGYLATLVPADQSEWHSPHKLQEDA